jgi:hypothetical protein
VTRNQKVVRRRGAPSRVGMIVLRIMHFCADDFCQGGWHFSRPSDTCHRSEYTKTCTLWQGILLSKSAGLAQCNSGYSLLLAFLLEASSTKENLNMLFSLVPSFMFSGLYRHL